MSSRRLAHHPWHCPPSVISVCPRLPPVVNSLGEFSPKDLSDWKFCLKNNNTNTGLLLLKVGNFLPYPITIIILTPPDWFEVLYDLFYISFFISCYQWSTEPVNSCSLHLLPVYLNPLMCLFGSVLGHIASGLVREDRRFLRTIKSVRWWELLWRN